MVAPLVAAAGISAGASLLGGLLGSSSAKKAAKISAASAERINAENLGYARETRDANTALWQPTVDRGNAAGGQINALLGLGGDAAGATAAFQTFRDSAGYQDAYDQAMRATNTGYAARGALESGAAQKALQKNASVLAGNYFGNYFSGLQGQQGAGTTGMSALAGANTTFSTNAINSNTALGAASASAQANGALGSGAAWTNALSGVAGAAGNLFGSSYGAPKAMIGPATGGLSPTYGGALSGGTPGGIYPLAGRGVGQLQSPWILS